MAKDKFKYFRIEARELLDGLSKCLLEIDRGSAGKEVIARLLRFAHTLKGASRVVKLPGIAELAHAVEDALAPYRDGDRAIPNDQVVAVMKILDQIGAKINELDRPAEPEKQGAAPQSVSVDENFETVRVETRQLDALLEGLARIGMQLSRLRHQLDDIGRAGVLADEIVSAISLGGTKPGQSAARGATALELRELLTQSARNLSTVSGQALSELEIAADLSYELRLLPAGSIFSLLERAVYDAGQSLRKKVKFTAEGGEIRMDAQVLAGVRNALLHVVRNAVAHGIESEDVRAAAGKHPTGHVSLRVERSGSRVALICHDDGQGIDTNAVRRIAMERGLLPADSAATIGMEKAVELLMHGGMTTASKVNEIAGRGIGLDVVRETVGALKGEVHVSSEAGKGATVELVVPVSLSSLAALVVDAGGSPVSIPLDAVRQTMRVSDAEIARTAAGSSVKFSDATIPFLPLAKALRRPAGAGQRPFWTCAVVQSGGQFAAFGVNRLLGTANVVVRPLPPTMEADPVVSGVSLTLEGEPRLLLDPAQLVELALRGGALEAAKTIQRPPPILVIDDSLTTRMLEQSILTSAGYAVELASSAEEALEKARDSRFSLFIVDVEMPGMDGYTFVERTRADPQLREIPAVMVTSRNAPEDLLRGKTAGARAYIVKSEFDQGQLLQTIRNLIG